MGIRRKDPTDQAQLHRSARLGILEWNKSDFLADALGPRPTALAGAHNGLGVAYARQGDVKRAMDEWREALRLRPDLEDARANLARVGAAGRQ